jgi:hypothetical protein
MLNLAVGDLHPVPEELDDCEAVLDLVEETADKHRVDVVTFMGDQHDTHDAMSVRVLGFYVRRFDRLKRPGRTVVGIVGNHDMWCPTEQFPHAMMAYPQISVVDHPRLVLAGDSGFAAMPYYPDPKEFVKAANRLAEENGDDLTLFCHQTFAGAVFDNGWKPEDAVDPAVVRFKHVVSGHIHTPQTVGGKVFYVGAPRWRTRSDAGAKRALTLFEHTTAGTRLVERIDTGPRCRRIHCFQDSPDTPVDLTGLDTKKDRVYVDVYGPISYTRPREVELKARGAQTRGFPDREKRALVSEAEGIGPGFLKFGAAFKPPYGTDQQSLLNEAGRRLGFGLAA